jgi:hypothetical protein
MNVTKQQFEDALADLARELDHCPPGVFALLVDGIAEMRGCRLDEALDELCELREMIHSLLQASESIKT